MSSILPFNIRLLCTLACIALCCLENIALSAPAPTNPAPPVPADASAEILKASQEKTAKVPDEPKMLFTGSDLEGIFYGTNPATGGNHSLQEKLLWQARDAYKKDKLIESYKLYKRVLRIAGPLADPYTNQASALCGLADCYVKQGSLEHAEKLILQAISMVGVHRNSWQPITALADFYANQNKMVEAESECRKALLMCEKYFPAKSYELALCQLNLGILLAQNKRFDEAQSWFDKATKSVDKDQTLYWKARANSAYLLAVQGKDTEAEAEYAKAIQELMSAKKFVRVLLPELIKNRGTMIKRLGNPALATRLFKETEEAEKEWKNTPAQSVDFSKYMASLQRRIRKQWHPPKDLISKRVVVRFKVGLQGAVSELQLVAPSAIDAADKAALAAVEKASPMEPLPAGADEPVDIQFTFDYNAHPGYGMWGY
jgi:TonB family protein